jgi:hypothetical protein
MTREIKFRAWNKKTQRIDYNVGTTDEPLNEQFIDARYEFMQFTGLLTNT